MKKALFWDFDGTLVKANDNYVGSLCIALCEQGYEIPENEVRSFLHTVLSWHRPQHTYPDQTGSKWWDSLFAACNSFYEKHRIPFDKWNMINTAYRNHILTFPYELYEDTEETLKKCMEMGYTNYLISNNYPELTDIICVLGLSSYLKSCFVSSHLGYEKPCPEIFQAALRTAGCCDPSVPHHCYMIGDNPNADIPGAKAQGITAILVHRGNGSAADFHCDTLREIPGLLL